MPGDPKECREHARNCIEMAEQAVTAQGRATLINLANHWTKLATELESAQTFLNSLKAMELNTPSDGRTAPGNGGYHSGDVARRRKSAFPRQLPR